MKLIVLGAPGAGKGTQAEIISDQYGIPIIGTGNLIREAIKSGSPLGKEIEEAAKTGKLVADAIVIQMLKDRLALPDAEKGYILDGFPRNVAQAEALKEMGIVVDKVLNIHVPDQEITQRITGRRVCGKCGSSYHIVYKKPKVEGLCDRDEEALIIREDDKPDVVANRLKVYHDDTEPLVGYYSNLGLLVSVNGLGGVEEITQLIVKALGDQ